ncbi:MAG: prepilin-type N-terminal cleavage/methylation domain-containing protein, partial [Clostridia bacterium]|nr:prepilin-type N-terminal cleavage/methylation domain-containing protein [Clostridia bacterium]
MKTKKQKKAFTLVELVIVIAVIAILAAVLLPSFASIINNAKENARFQQITTARNELLGSSSEIATILDLEGYVFVIDKKVYIIDNQGQVMPVEDLEYEEVTLEFTKSETQPTNKNVVVYLPRERIETPLKFTINEEDKTAIVS